VVRRVLAAATSPFTRTTKDQVDPRTSPFTRQPLADYENSLAAIDPGRTWLKMLRPGAQGWGIVLAAYNPFVCCQGQDLRYAAEDNQGVPLLFPAVVQWCSVVDPATGLLAADLSAEEGYDRDLNCPVIGLASDWWLDDGVLMPWVNAIHHEDAMWEETEYSVGQTGQVITGLVAPWQVLPVTEQAAGELKAFLSHRQDVLGTFVLSRTNCEMTDVYDDDWFAEDHFVADPDHPELVNECAYELGRDLCACGERPTGYQLWDALVEPLVEGVYSTEELFVPPELIPLWRLACRNYAIGWLASAIRSAEGDIWSTWSWQRLSPFSGSHSLALLLQRLSTHSTSSATPPASSPGSSRQLTLSDW